MTWAFICSLSEAQKGAEDRGQIKALVGGLPVRSLLGVSTMTTRGNFGQNLAKPSDCYPQLYGRAFTGSVKIGEVPTFCLISLNACC